MVASLANNSLISKNTEHENTLTLPVDWKQCHTVTSVPLYYRLYYESIINLKSLGHDKH